MTSCFSLRAQVATLALATILSAGAHAQHATDVESQEALRSTLRSSILPEAYRNSGIFPGQCVIWGEKAYMLSPFEDAQQVDAFVDKLEVGANPRYQILNRITTTATDGPGLVNLQQITVTYSFVPDGTFVPGDAGAGSVDGPSTLISVMNSSFGGESEWKPIFAQAFGRIGELTGISYVEVTDDGAPLHTSPGSNTPGSTRGDVRISMRPFAGGGGVLAYNYFPNNMDMVIDSHDIGLWTNFTNSYRTFRNMLMHEHGHGTGYLHMDPAPPAAGGNTKLLEPFLSTSFDGPQEADIRGWQIQYGDGNEPNESPATATPLGLLNPPLANGSVPNPKSFTNNSLENGFQEDYFSFTIPQPNQLLEILITPAGTSYSQGPQGGATSVVQGNRILDLRYRLIAPDMTTVLIDDNQGGLGDPESEFNFDLGPTGAGDYFLHIFSNDTTMDIQRYNILLSYRAKSSVEDWWLMD